MKAQELEMTNGDYVFIFFNRMVYDGFDNYPWNHPGDSPYANSGMAERRKAFYAFKMVCFFYCLESAIQALS